MSLTPSEVREKFAGQQFDFEDTKYFLVVTMDDSQIVMGVIDEDEDSVYCYVGTGGEPFGLKKGTVTSCPKTMVTQQCEEGITQIISLDEAREKHLLSDQDWQKFFQEQSNVE